MTGECDVWLVAHDSQHQQQQLLQLLLAITTATAPFVMLCTVILNYFFFVVHRSRVDVKRKPGVYTSPETHDQRSQVYRLLS